MIKALLLDFDGTVVTHDMLHFVCGITGKEEESRRIHKEFLNSGVRSIQPLVERINLLRGATLDQIRSKVLEDTYLMPGARELIDYARSKSIITFLASGNIQFILEIYQKELGIDYILGTQPEIRDDIVVGLEENHWPSLNFKAEGLKKLLGVAGIDPRESIAIGDSRVDRGMFELAGHSIAINPKEGIENEVDYVIRDDLSKAIPIIEQLSYKYHGSFS